MNKLVIDGGRKLCGETYIHGAKNGALPILAAALTINGISVIHNCADLSDVRVSVKILQHFGCKVRRENNTLIIDAANVTYSPVPDSLMREMRSSVIFLSALISRFKRAQMCTPGGCELGPRPIDMHISAMKMLGANVSEEQGLLVCECDILKGSEICLPLPSVGATENIIIAAATARGTTKLCNAAREPEIVCLAEFLNKAGAKIQGAGTGDIVIEGVSALHECEHTVLPDRIVAATVMSAVAVTGGSAVIHNVCEEHLNAVISVYRKAGCEIDCSATDMKITANKRLAAVKSVNTGYYPGFPTDAGPMFTALAATADGTTVMFENIFENRFKFTGELARLGAQIKVKGNTAVIYGCEKLYGGTVKCTDLRGGAALMVAAFGAEGTTEIENISHIERGYENSEKLFAQLSANIRRT